MRNIIIAGSSGMIGSLVLKACLNRADVGKITIINRKPCGLTHEKLNEVIHHDFLNFSAVENYFENQDICFYCVGIYTGQVPADEFKKITVGFTQSFADMLKHKSPQASFCFLSGQGADSTEKSNILFAREKGIAENYLIGLKFKNIHIFRPGYIYPDTPRKEPNFGYKLMRLLYKPVSFVYPNIGLTSKRLASKMVEVGFAEPNKIIFENAEIRN